MHKNSRHDQRGGHRVNIKEGAVDSHLVTSSRPMAGNRSTYTKYITNTIDINELIVLG